MTWDVTSPAGTDNIALGDNVIREFKTDIQTALQAEGAFPVSTSSPVFRPRGGKGATGSIPSASDGGLYYDTTLGTWFRSTGSQWEPIIGIASGDTASRVSNPLLGTLYNNTETAFLERYNGSSWDELIYAPDRSTGTTVSKGGVAISSSSGSVSLTSSFAAVTNLEVTITTSGRPIMLALIGSGTSGSYISVEYSSANGGVEVYFDRGGTQLNRLGVVRTNPGSSVQDQVSPTSVWHVDTPSAGTYTYKLYAKEGAGTVGTIANCALVAYEL